MKKLISRPQSKTTNTDTWDFMYYEDNKIDENKKI